MIFTPHEANKRPSLKDSYTLNLHTRLSVNLLNVISYISEERRPILDKTFNDCGVAQPIRKKNRN